MRRVAGEQQVFTDRLLILFRTARLAGQQAQHTVGVADRRHFGIGHHDGVIGKVHGQMRAPLDARRGVADDVVVVFGQFVKHTLNAFQRQGILVAGLRGGKDEEVFAALVLDQRLIQAGFVVDDVDEVIHHAALAAHDEVKVAQADVEVDDDGAVATQGQSHGNGGTGRGFSDPTLA